MKHDFYPLKQVNHAITYCVEFLKDGLLCQEYVYAIDSKNGVVLDAPEGLDTYIGRLVSGGLISIPIESLTNVFQALKVQVNSGQGIKTYHIADSAEDEYVENAMQNPKQWDENGCLKGNGQGTNSVEYQEKIPDGAKRIIR